ncbi:MAG TPA: sulfotransferase [Actinomycetota bacterium]|nr:sulfotransferase [Actinomycetota bacterium]
MFFVVGSARSGTTLLRLMLNAHPEIAVPPESRFIVELWSGAETVDRDRFLQALAGHKRFRVWDLPIEAVANELDDTTARVRYADAIEGAYRAYAHVQGKTRFGDKTPRYVEHIDFLADLFPQARFVHLVRDGRNVALSYGGVPFGPKNVAKAADLWRRRVGAGIKSGRKLDQGRYLELRYEDLTAEPHAQVRILCDFLGIVFDEGMLQYTERARDAVLARSAENNPHLLEGTKAGVREWQREMPTRHVEIFEAVAGPELEQLGYELRYPNAGTAARVLARLSRWGLPVARLRKE